MSKSCLKCGANIPNQVKKDGKIYHTCNRKYCVQCSPLGQRNNKQLHLIKTCSKENIKVCSRCQKEKELNCFYKHNSNGLHAYCKDCMVEMTLERQRIFKCKCIEYKGGQCIRCGYNKCYAALQFHHIDPTKKDFGISRAKQRQFDDTIKKELDKCLLVCATCHAEIHWENYRVTIGPVTEYAARGSNSQPLP